MFVLYCSLSTVIPSGRLLTDEQIFIIVGVVVGTVVLIVTLLSIIFVILAIRDRKNNGSRRKRKYCNAACIQSNDLRTCLISIPIYEG